MKYILMSYYWFACKLYAFRIFRLKARTNALRDQIESLQQELEK